MIKNMTKKDQPRERLIEKGASALKNSELLAIMLGTGNKKKDVLKLSEEILAKYPVFELKNLSYEQMIDFEGIHTAKACQLLACFELAKRAVSMEEKRITLDSPKTIYQWLYGDFYLESNEILIVVYVDCKLQPLKKKIYREESAFQINLPIRMIVADAIHSHAYGIILLHNHPSGSVEPSEADICSTIELQSLLQKMDVVLLEHLVVSPKDYYSFASNGIFEDFD